MEQDKWWNKQCKLNAEEVKVNYELQDEEEKEQREESEDESDNNQTGLFLPQIGTFLQHMMPREQYKGL